MEKLTPIEELDFMLKFFWLSPYARPYLSDGEIDTFCNQLQNVSMIKRHNAERKIPIERLTKILEKLKKDKYIDSHIKEGKELYKITWDGEFFISSEDGYSGKLRRNQKEANDIKDLRNRQSELLEMNAKESTRMGALTKWIAFGAIVTAIYYIVMLIDYCLTHHVFCCP